MVVLVVVVVVVADDVVLVVVVVVVLVVVFAVVFVVVVKNKIRPNLSQYIFNSRSKPSVIPDILLFRDILRSSCLRQFLI